MNEAVALISVRFRLVKGEANWFKPGMPVNVMMIAVMLIRQDLIHELGIRQFISLFTTHAFRWRMRWNVQMVSDGKMLLRIPDEKQSL